MKDYSSDPTLDLLAAVYSAVSGTPVKPGAFPPPPPSLPPLHVNHPSNVKVSEIYLYFLYITPSFIDSWLDGILAIESQ